MFSLILRVTVILQTVLMLTKDQAIKDLIKQAIVDCQQTIKEKEETGVFIITDKSSIIKELLEDVNTDNS